MSAWRWRPVKPGDLYCIVPYRADGERMPYSVAKVIVRGVPRYEAWHQQQYLSHHQMHREAMEACERHSATRKSPPP